MLPMKLNRPLLVRLGEPSHGWLRVQIRWENGGLGLHASDVSNDALEEICDMVLQIPHVMRRTITCWEEPHTTILIITRNGEEYTLEIEEASNFGEPGKTVYRLQGDYAMLVVPFRQAILQYAQLYGESEHWHPLPMNKIAQLQQVD